MEPGQLCRVVATFIEDRDGRALVRLPNGSKSSVPYGAIEGAQARAHFVASPDDSTVEVFCLDVHDATSADSLTCRMGSQRRSASGLRVLAVRCVISG